MRVSDAEAAKSQERILQGAARLFRENGFEGVGVAAIMDAAGMTHGGFYKHFKSKGDLMIKACDAALEQNLGFWANADGARPLGTPGETLRAYLSPAHRDNPGAGCVLAALAADAGRQSEPQRAAMENALRAIASALSENLPPAESLEAREDQALAKLSQMVGALMLSRAVKSEALSEQILRAAAQDILSRPE